MSEAIDQSVNYINLRYFHHLLLFPPLGTNARPEKPAKIHSSDTVLLGTKYFIIIWKESNGGASRQYLLHLHMTLLDGKLLMGEPKYLIGGEGGVFAGDYFLGRRGKYFLFGQNMAFFALMKY